MEKPSKNNKWIATIFAVIVLAFALKSIFLKPDSTTNISTKISIAFNDIGELATENYNFSNVGKYEGDKLKAFGIEIPFTGKRCLITYDGTAKIGISDISKITASVDNSSKKILVSCPKLELLGDPVINPSSIEVYDQTFNIVNQISINDFSNFLTSEINSTKQAILDKDLFENAKEHTRNVLTSSIKSITSQTDIKDYEVEIEYY